MRNLNEYINEGLLNTDISDLDASVVIDDFWKLASDFGRGAVDRKNRKILDKFINYLPVVKAWAEDNAVNMTDRNARGIAVGKEELIVLGEMNIYEFLIKNNQMKYACVNASWYMGPAAKSRMDIKRQFVSVYEEKECQVFWVDKKKVRLFKR